MYNYITSVFVFASLANASGVVHLPFERHARQAPADYLAKRSSGAVTLPEEFNKYYYMAEVKAGTPLQTVKVEIDTSTTGMMFLDTGNNNCANFTDEYIPYGFPGYPSAENISCWNPTVFNSSNSSSLYYYLDDDIRLMDENEEDDFEDDWLDGTFYVGHHDRDTLQIGGSTIYNYTIGTNIYGNHTMSVLGLGLTTDAYFLFRVISVPHAMVKSNITSFNGYSIYLNGKDSNEGSVIFGGVDHSKYEGTLQTIPVTNAQYPDETGDELGDDYFALIMVNGISLYDGSESVEVASFALNFGITTDYFYTVLPTPFVDAIAQSIGGERYGKYILVPCDLNGGLTFNLSGSNISVPFDEMVFPLEDGTCHLAITDTTDADYSEGTYSNSTFFLGESFMRAAYVVYNLNANGEDEDDDDFESRTVEISIAKAKYNASSDSVEAITGSTVPSATRAPYYSHTNDSTHWATTVYSNFITASNTSLGGSSFTDAPITMAYINTVNQTGTGTTITTAHATGVDSTASASTSSAAAASANGAASGAASASSSSSSSKGGKKKNAASRTNVPTMFTASALFLSAFLMAVLA